MKKYGTNGKVKERVIRYESSTQRVVWNSKKSKLRRMSSTGSAGSTGVDDNAIALSEMTGIALGAFPGVTMDDVHASYCLSILSSRRRLDLETFDAETRDLLADGFELLIASAGR